MLRQIAKNQVTQICRQAHWIRANVSISDIPKYDPNDSHNFIIDKGELTKTSLQSFLLVLTMNKNL